MQILQAILGLTKWQVLSAEEEEQLKESLEQLKDCGAVAWALHACGAAVAGVTAQESLQEDEEAVENKTVKKLEAVRDECPGCTS